MQARRFYRRRRTRLKHALMRGRGGFDTNKIFGQKQKKLQIIRKYDKLKAMKQLTG